MHKIDYVLNAKQKKAFILLVFAITIGSFLETFSVSMVMPLVNLISNPSSIYSEKKYIFFANIFNISDVRSMILLFALLLIFVYIIKNIYLILMYKYQYDFIYINQDKLSCNILQNYLAQDYLFHATHNVADLQRNIRNDVDAFFQELLSISVLFTEFCTCLFLAIYLLIQDVLTTLVVIGIMVGYIFIWGMGFRKKIKDYGKKERVSASSLNKWILQSLGGIKELKIGNMENYFLDNYRMSYDEYAKAHSNYLLLNLCARPTMETVLICGLLGFLSIRIYFGADLNKIVPIISVFVVAAIRMLPSFSRISNNFSTMTYYKSGMDNIFYELQRMEKQKKEMEKDNDDQTVIHIKDKISIRNLVYHYPTRPEHIILNNVTLDIKKHDMVAFIGPSGAGKTTFADIILGILRPTSGTIEVDGKSIFEHLNSWHKIIGYIPQTIFLIDDSIRANIAYGVRAELIDEDRVWQAIKDAQLDDFVKNLEKGLDTVVGDRGVRLSGGQRQRIGIARALYREPRLLVLDEATSALDNDTEEAVMKAINSLNGKLTMIVIAHRLSTIQQCDHVYEVKDGNVRLIKNETTTLTKK